jgi:hypothetical protein
MHRLSIGSKTPRTGRTFVLHKMRLTRKTWQKVTMKTVSTKEKPRGTQAEVGRTDEIPFTLHINPFFICGQKSRDLQQVRAKRKSKDMAANVAKTHKEGRYFTQRYATGLQ